MQGVTHINNGRRQNQSPQQVNKDEEPHRETTEAKQFRQKHELAKIVYRRVDPTTTLREQDPPRLGCHGVRYGVRTELGLECREVLHHERRQETILSEREQILLVQRINVGLGVLVDDAVRDDDRATLVSRANTIEGETAGQTGDGAEERLERLGKMVGDVVFVHLDHRPPRALLVLEFRLPTDSDDT